ncbi:MAG: CopG family transcriptional regulator [Acidimicrobiales bacterium]
MPRLTVTLPRELVEEVRARAGRGGVSSWIAQAAAERLSRERLAAAIADYEAEAGPITEGDIAAARTRSSWKPAAQRRKPPTA